MTIEAIQQLIGEAVTNFSLRRRLLSSGREQVLQGRELTEAERQAVMGARGDSLSNFAEDLHQYVMRTQLKTPNS